MSTRLYLSPSSPEHETKIRHLSRRDAITGAIAWSAATIGSSIRAEDARPDHVSSERFDEYRRAKTYEDHTKVRARIGRGILSGATRTVFRAPRELFFEVDITSGKGFLRRFYSDGLRAYQWTSATGWVELRSVGVMQSAAFGAAGPLGGGGFWCVTLLLPDGESEGRNLRALSGAVARPSAVVGGVPCDVINGQLGNENVTVSIGKTDGLIREIGVESSQYWPSATIAVAPQIDSYVRMPRPSSSSAMRTGPMSFA